MKYFLFSFLTLLILTSCNSQSDAKNQAREVQAAIEQNRPGTLPATDGGWTMTATLNGKPWKASSLMPPDVGDRIIGYYNNDYLALPYSKESMTVGYKFKLGENDGGYSVEYFTPGAKGNSVTSKGEMIVTKVGEGWAESTFHFTSTATGNDKTLEVTDGFFRIKIK